MKGLVTLLQIIFVKKDSLAAGQAFVAPLAVPFAPAVLMGSEIMQSLLAGQADYWLALFAAIMSAVGLEAVGGLSSYTAILKAQRKQWGQMVLAVGCCGIYILILVAAMVHFQAPVLGFFALLTPAAFVGAAIWQADGLFVDEKQQEDKAQLARIREKKNLINAQARLAKVNSLDLSILGKDSADSVNIQENSVIIQENSAIIQEDSGKGSRIIQLWLAGERNKSEIARQVGCDWNTVQSHLIKQGLVKPRKKVK